MPRHRTIPATKTSAGQEAVELAASAGLHLDPWQCQVLEDSLGETPDGQWAAFEVGLIVPRQNGKGSILEARELAGLYLFGEQLILHSAHEFKTAAEAFRRVLFLIESTPDLERRVMKVRTSHGEEGIELRTGQRLRFVARSTGSGRGFSGDTVILDEAYNLTDKGMSALLPTMAARPNPQLWYTSSAPLETDESEVLRRLCKRGRAGSSKSLAYMEFCAADDVSLDDEAAWGEANPSLGYRVTVDFIEKERQALTDDDFARERLGIWHEPATNANQVIPTDRWIACADVDAGIDGIPVFGLDVAEDRAWAAFSAAGHSTVEGFLQIELVDYRDGTNWVVARGVELVRKWGAKLVLGASSPASSLVKDFLSAGLVEGENLLLLPQAEVARACGELYDAVMNDRLRHRDQPAMTVSVRNAAKRSTGDEAWIWSRRKSSTDISPLVAATLALTQVGLPPEPEPVAAGFVSLAEV